MVKSSFVLLITACLLSNIAYSQPVYLSNGGACSFFSNTPVENINALSESVSAMLNTSTKELMFKIPITSFKFKKALMQEHFNEKYMESGKFPTADFKGKLNEDVDFSKDTVMQVTATGVINIHGTDKTITETGTLSIKNKLIQIGCEFKVALKDYNIRIPKFVVTNIAEMIAVKIDCSYRPFKKESK